MEILDKINVSARDLLRPVRNKILGYLPGHEPYFLIVGAQKSGTSSLHYYLSKHADLKASLVKEVNFFNRGMLSDVTTNDYHKNFVGFRHDKKFFESSPDYLSSPGCAARIHSVLPSIKIIIIVREPVGRAYSAWNHYRQIFENPREFERFRRIKRPENNKILDLLFLDRAEFPTFREAIDIELTLANEEHIYEPAIVRRGFYIDQIREFWRYYEKNNVLLVGYKDLTNDTEKVLRKIEKFLDISSQKWPDLIRTSHNTRSYKARIAEADRLYLEQIYAPKTAELFAEVGPLNW